MGSGYMLNSGGMQPKRIFVALSGGVDSAVAAALLQRDGYEVQGVYLKYASEIVHGLVNTRSCSWEQDLESVRAVGKQLNIPVQSLNVERQYNQAVVAAFLREYATGRTPNPDILCNRDIKFGLFLRWAKERGADAIATGHYARIGIWEGRSVLLAGADHDKDQSYFLYALPADHLPNVRFPIGHLTKPQVRQLAKKFRLPNADRPDSQGICFVGNLNVRKFLERFIPSHPGPIITTDGQLVGQHPSLSYFTIGQRHGLGLGGGAPYYIVGKDLKRNTLLVSRGANDSALYQRVLLTGEISWTAGPPVDHTLLCQARIRYRQPLETALVERRRDGTAVVTFAHRQRAITPGQAIVFYHDDLVLGGAVIDRVLAVAQPSSRLAQFS